MLPEKYVYVTEMPARQFSIMQQDLLLYDDSLLMRCMSLHHGLKDLRHNRFCTTDILFFHGSRHLTKPAGDFVDG